MGVRIFAAIDVGSYETMMNIYELSGTNKMKKVDSISRRIDLGSDTYAHGKIGKEKMDELCRTLADFARIKSSYHAQDYKAYGTSAFREADNPLVLKDQIALRTGLEVDVLSNSEQRFLDYKSIASKGAEFTRIIEDKAAIVDIGGGSIQISLFDKDTLVSTQNIRIGVLRIQEIIQHLNVKNQQKEKLIDELISTQLSNFKKMYLKDRELQSIIVVDDYISLWAMKRSKGSDKSVVTLDELEKLVEMMHTHNTSEIAAKFDIPEEKIQLVMISAIMLKRIIKITEAQNLWVPGVTLCDGIAYEYGEQIGMFGKDHDFEQDILACAMNISKRYQCSKKRYEMLDNLSTIFFDSTRKLHGLGKRERLYLRIASILLDCGNYISMVDVGENSYNIILSTEIIGLSHLERLLVASIVRYSHGKFSYYYGQEDLSWLNSEDYLVVAKLTAILRLANSLAKTGKQKITDVQAKINDDRFLIQVDCPEDLTLEKNFLEGNAEFFREVFSIEPVLMQRKQI